MDASVPATSPRAATSRSVRRALKILELIAASQEPVAVNAISTGLSIPRTTAYEILRTLVAGGLIEPAQADTGRFQLGNALYRLGMAYRRQVDLLREAAPIVETLRDTVGETVQFSVLDKGKVLVLMKEDSRQPIAIVSHVGSRLPVNWSASGRLLMSDLSDAQLRARLPSMLQASPTGKATTEVAAFIAQVRMARARGYDVRVSQASAHTGAVAAPAIAASGRCVATVSIVMPAHRFAGGGIDAEIEAVKAAAATLSHRLGDGTSSR